MRKHSMESRYPKAFGIKKYKEPNKKEKRRLQFLFISKTNLQKNIDEYNYRIENHFPPSKRYMGLIFENKADVEIAKKILSGE